VRLEVLDRGHTLRTKALFAMIRLMTRRRVPDVIKTLLYRPEYLGGQLNLLFQEVMRGPSAWSVGDRELMAAYVSKTNECEF
jgi:hypothetical protein